MAVRLKVEGKPEYPLKNESLFWTQANLLIASCQEKISKLEIEHADLDRISRFHQILLAVTQYAAKEFPVSQPLEFAKIWMLDARSNDRLCIGGGVKDDKVYHPGLYHHTESQDFCEPVININDTLIVSGDVLYGILKHHGVENQVYDAISKFIHSAPLEAV